MGVATPTFIPEPFAAGAAGAYLNFPIPDTPPPMPANAASWHLGFPPITMQTEISGGLPPLGQDVNGILLSLSQSTYALQAGQPYGFNASFAGTISGYALGAVLGMADGTGLWLNTLAGNSANPDTAGTSWVPGIAYGKSSLAGLTGGTVTLTAAQSKYALIVLGGVLSSNLTVVFPATIQQWIIVNNTTGAYTTTAKTASGTGVGVPQGGPGSVTAVYGDGTNLNSSQAPLAVPISQSATPLTLAERTNSGYLFAVYYNQSSSVESPAVGSVFVQNTGADGYLRKISLSGLEAQMSLSAIGGQVSAAQVPVGAVTQYDSILYTSAALTGTPTAPTAAAGTASTQIATTAFVNPGSVRGTNGWEQRPSGIIEQWGAASYSGSGSTLNVSFPRTFPNQCFNVTCAVSVSGFNAGIGSFNTGGWTALTNQLSGTALTIYWRAIGF